MENLSTQDSLKIIQTVIDQRKQKYEENGIFLLIWGFLIMLAGITQYIMMQTGKGHISGYAWLFTMVPGALVTYIYGYKEAKKAIKNNSTPDMMGWLWGFAGAMAMTTGFFLNSKFGIGFTFTLFAPFCIAAMSSALSLRNYFWIFLCITAMVIAYISLFIPFIYHPLISASIALLIFMLPGIQLYRAHKKRQNV